MNATEKARWLAVSPRLAVDGATRPARPARRSVVPLAVIDLVFHVQGIALLSLRGEHDLSGRQRLAEALAAAEPQRDLLIDLSDCSFIDSSVIATLVLARKRLVARGGHLELLIPRGAATVQRIAKATSLAAVLPIHETLSAALASFKPVETV